MVSVSFLVSSFKMASPQILTLVYCLLTIFCAQFAFSTDNLTLSPVITLTQGKIQGATRVSRNSNKYFAFLGVPYARAARFGAPLPVEPWTDTKQVTEVAPPCLQFVWDVLDYMGTEDCLTLDIYTPTLSEDSKLPVMILFHGGGFQLGYSAVGNGKYLVDENVVMISVQYRLGALGFLNVGTDDSSVVPNAGLRDQNAAIRWVRDNVHLFGGDKEKITLFGYSAGGAAVHYQMLSPMSKGLFARAISESGSALNPWALQPNPKELAKQLAQNVGCAINDTKQMVECLRKRSATEITKGQMQLSKFSHEFDVISMLFVPSVEEGNSEPKFLPDTPYKIIKSGKTASKVPWISGLNTEEGAFFTALILENETSLEIINSNWDKMAPNMLYYENTSNPEMHNWISRKVWDRYLKKKKIGLETYLQFGRALSDRYFYTGVRRAIMEHARMNEFPIYSYIFKHQGNHSIVQGFLHVNRSYGVSHTDELQYLFHQTCGSPGYESGTEGEFSKNFVKLFASFAHTGKPQTFGAVKDWPPIVNSETGIAPWLVIDDDTNLVKEDWLKEGTDFWEGLPISENQNEDKKFSLER